jgi:hypothetical protein
MREWLHLGFLSADKNSESLNLTSKFQSHNEWKWIKAMTDSRATELDYIDINFTKTHNMNLQRLETPWGVLEFDGKLSAHGLITHYVVLKLWFDRHVEYICLYVTVLKGWYNMILNYQWLKLHNSWIDWIHETVKFKTQHCRSHCLHGLS